MINKILVTASLFCTLSNAEILVPDNVSNENNDTKFYKFGIFDAITSVKREVANMTEHKNKFNNLTGRYIVYSKIKNNNFNELIYLKNIAMKMNLFDAETVINQDNEPLLLYSINSREADAKYIQKRLLESNIKTSCVKVNEYMKFEYNPIITKDIIWGLRDALKDVPTKVIVVEKKEYIPIETTKVIEKKEIKVKEYHSNNNQTYNDFNLENSFNKQFGTKRLDKEKVKVKVKEERKIVSTKVEKIKDEKIDTNILIKMTLSQIKKNSYKVKNKEAIIINNKEYENGSIINGLTINKIEDKIKGKYIATYISFKEDMKNKNYLIASVSNTNIRKNEIKEKSIKPIITEPKEIKKDEPKIEKEKKSSEKKPIEKIDSGETKILKCDFTKIRKIYQKKLGKLSVVRVTENSEYFNKIVEGKIIGEEDNKYLINPIKDFNVFYLNKKYVKRGYCIE